MELIMIRKILVLISVLCAINAFANLQANADSAHLNTICSPTKCYTILKELGEGAFGKVYAVEDSLGQHYAIKSYKPQTNPHFANHVLANAEREYMRGQLLNHSNIVKTFDLFEVNYSPDNHTTYLVLELVEGTTVFDIPKKSLGLHQALYSSLQLVDALRYALSQKLLHLDLHEGNIMLSHSLDTMVIDLASFYSFDEILNFAQEKQQEEEEQPKVIKNQVDAQFAPVKKAKLKQFFLQNPGLLEKVVKAHNKNKKEQPAKNKKPQKIDSDQIQMMPLLSNYFNNITEICVRFITKSNLSREKKLKLRTAIKILAWNYLEDVEENLVVPIDYYFDQLIAILTPL
jgi:serine/threonine protein kinase